MPPCSILQGGISCLKLKGESKMADWKTERRKVKEITDRLESGLQDLFESEKYKTYLNTMSRFHNYSVNNMMLIAMQMPDATLVAGYNAWQKNFERHVNKGEKGINILAPAPYVVKEERDKRDTLTGEIMFDDDGMPMKEEVEIRIPAFKVVSVFDISQTDGKPLPELGTDELLATVEGYEDFKQAITNVSPFSINYKEIPNDSKGRCYYNEKQIDVQSGMSESQTIQTLIHEVTHATLHTKALNDEGQMLIDTRTREVQAESIAYTVCQHFGIDTSDFSFGYIAGWSQDRSMPELKSSLDTIRKTASELITRIEAQLQEIQRDREVMQEQEKDNLLLVQNADLTEYSMLSVRGMDSGEIATALSEMGEEDKRNVAAYLESKGAWTLELGNERTEEVEAFRLDVRYNTDTNEIYDLKAERDMDEKAKEPIGANDVILKITHADGFEVERITNKTEEEVKEIMAALSKLEVKDRENVRKYLNSNGVDFIPIIVSGGRDRNADIPQFNDFEIDLIKRDAAIMHLRSAKEQAEGIINRLEFAQPAFSADERELIVNYARMINDMDKTRELAEHIYYEETEGNQGAALAVIDAQAEIDTFPDPAIGFSAMEEYGYTNREMFPLTKEKALELFDHNLPVYLLHDIGRETRVDDREQIIKYDGIFGIEKEEWEAERFFREMQKELEESTPNKEAQLLYGSTDKFGIYQLKDKPELNRLHFESTENLKKLGKYDDVVKLDNYNLIYVGELSELKENTREETLEAIFEKFNIDRPEDFRGHSLSVSDMVVLQENGENTAHYVDSFGFTEIPEFIQELTGEKGQEMQEEENVSEYIYKVEPNPRSKSIEDRYYLQAYEVQDRGSVVPDDVLYVGQLGKCRELMGQLRAGEITNSEVIELLKKEKPELGNAIVIYKDDLSYAHEHGEEVAYRLSARVNTECRNAIESILQDKSDGTSLSADMIKPLLEQYGTERMSYILSQSMGRNPKWHEHLSPDNKAWMDSFNVPFSINQGIEVDVRCDAAILNTFIGLFREVIKEYEIDEIIDLGDDREKVLADMKKSLENGKEKELAFSIGDCFISIQEVEEGYDYTIVGSDYKEIDGGVYDNPDISIREALNEVLEDIKATPSLYSVKENDKLVQIDFDELTEKIESANRIEPPSSVVEDFRAKTAELFHDISEMNPAEIEETVKCHVQAKLDETGIDAVIVDAVVVGSRCRGLEQDGSDLDVVVELSTDEREDVLFDTFNEDGLRIGGIKVDINPITAERTGTLETYLPQVEDYLEEVRASREMAEKGQVEVTLLVSECSEFHSLGELYENIQTVAEAIEVWRQIPPERMNGIPAIGINVHRSGEDSSMDDEVDLLIGHHIDLEVLEYYSGITGEPKAMETVAELIAKLPEIEIRGSMSVELESKVQEIRNADAHGLAVEIDQFVYDYDPHEYRDVTESREEGVESLYESIKNGDVEHITNWLQEVISEGAVPEETNRAQELLKKLSEYKPLAKIEEMEEQNYNMIDDILNNGGEKAQRDAVKSGQEQSDAKTSLKSRLAEKKAEVAGQGHDAQDKDNSKHIRREM